MQPGTIVASRFVIEALAGEGGMGKVYRALDRELEQHVALKILAENVSTHITRFVEEARILAALAHPGIVQWIAHGEESDGLRWLALEWLEGEDLCKRLTRGPLSVEDGIAMGIAVAEALAAAQAHGIIHRDIKPSNLFLVDGDPRHPKLLDFGVARRDSVTRVATQSGVIVGTAGYIPPEQIRGDPTDARADVFGLGAVLFECLAGQPPFAGGTMMAVLTSLLLHDPPPLRGLRHNVPPDLADLIGSMLAKDPSGRPNDATAVVDALRAIHPKNFRKPLHESADRQPFGDSWHHAFSVDATGSEHSAEHETRVGNGNALNPLDLFVGRTRELNTLVALFEECVEENVAQAVLVTGPAGIGKTRLCEEFLLHMRHEQPDAVIWTGRGEIADENASLGLLGAILLQAGHHAEDMDRAFLRLVADTLERTPLILVLEDLQWVDAESMMVVEQALDQFGDRPLFVLALARPDVHTRFSHIWHARDVQEISLGGLVPRAATKLVSHALGDNAEPAVIHTLVERADGHPLFLTELIRVAAAGRADALPNTVLTMVRARLAVLTSEERRFLRAASIFGNVFSVQGVLHLLGGDSSAIAQRLVDRNFLTRQQTSRRPGDDELSFRETLVREVAYATMSDADRTKGHALAAAWMESMEGARLRVTK